MRSSGVGSLVDLKEVALAAQAAGAGSQLGPSLIRDWRGTLGDLEIAS